MSRTTIDVGGLRLSALIEGKELGPWVTFAHSLATDATLFAAQAKALGARYRTLRFDMRGHGRSAAPPRPYALADLVGDVVGLWDTLEIERSHFVGLSIGGMTGFGLALDHPDRLVSLSACDCRADAPEFFRNMWDQREAIVDGQGLEGIVEPTIQTWFTEAARARDPALIDRVRAMIRGTSRDGYLGCGDALRRLDYKRRLGAIGTPTLMIVGDADGPHPQEMKALAAMIPGARLVEIGPAGHLSNLEQPEAFNAALIGFLDSFHERPR
ncbi:MAG: alpha/beta fold hydrolase [Geminicoccaceae bacterium]